jgi:hypothetical protein
MSCTHLVQNSVSYLNFLVIPGHAAQLVRRVNDRDKPFTKLMVSLNKIFVASVALSTISGVVLLRTVAQTTANRVFKAGFAGFGTIAALVALFGAVKLAQALRQS